MLSKEKTRKAFSRAAHQYDQYATWQQKTARFLVSQVIQEPISALDLGCGTGEIALLLRNKFPRTEIHGIDIAEGMITQAEKRSILENKPEIMFKIGDMEKIDYPAESFDLIISNLSVQWLNSPEKCFQEVKRLLKPDGIFLFNTILDGSQKELISTFKKYIHNFKQSHPFTKEKELLNCLKKSGFKNFKHIVTKETLYFQNFKAVVNSIRNVGAKAQKTITLTKTVLQKLTEHYPKTAQGCPLTYNLIIVKAKK